MGLNSPCVATHGPTRITCGGGGGGNGTPYLMPQVDFNFFVKSVYINFSIENFWLFQEITMEILGVSIIMPTWPAAL